MDLYEEQFQIRDHDFSTHIDTAGYMLDGDIRWDIFKTETHWTLNVSFPNTWRVVCVERMRWVQLASTYRIAIAFNKLHDFIWTRETLGMLTLEYLEGTYPGQFVTYQTAMDVLRNLLYKTLSVNILELTQQQIIELLPNG